MNIDNNYIDLLLRPLSNGAVLSTTQYFSQLDLLGITTASTDGRIDDKFKVHLNHLVRNRKISSDCGSFNLKKMGIEIGTNGHIIKWDCNIISR